MVKELIANGMAEESDGAICIFLDEKKKGVPLMIQKSDGGHNYDTTDLAAIRYRAQELKCDRLVYVTDLGQEFHFKSIFKGSEKCGFHDPSKCKAEHMGFGLVMLESINEKGEKTVGKMKTRSGDTIKLMELINEAKDRALAEFKKR